jgi:hypothetical protein
MFARFDTVRVKIVVTGGKEAPVRRFLKSNLAQQDMTSVLKSLKISPRRSIDISGPNVGGEGLEPPTR